MKEDEMMKDGEKKDFSHTAISTLDTFLKQYTFYFAALLSRLYL